MSAIFRNEGERTLLDSDTTLKKITLNYHKNREQDQTQNIELAAKEFSYNSCRHLYWNPPQFSLLYGTELWRQSSEDQRRILNHLYWVAYYSQIISAEIATILFNQTSAAGLYGVEDFRAVCDMLDLESAQERTHVHAFKTISESVEKELFGYRLFSYPMRTPYTETMIYPDSNQLKHLWRKFQLNAFSLLSSNNPFIACQYFAVRGVRTLNGKIVQHRLSQFYLDAPDKERTPIPARVSYHHFMDESYHFNSSRILSHDVLKILKPPTRFERWVINQGIRGCQRDHFNVSTAVNGIFWYDPALFPVIYKLLLSPIFSVTPKEAAELMRRCFCEESEGLAESFKTHEIAVQSYKAYVSDLDHLERVNKDMTIMSANNIRRHLRVNQSALARFSKEIAIQ